jgi:hypothetical protein
LNLPPHSLLFLFLAQKSLADARLIEVQDIQRGEDNCPKLIQGVAPNRQIAIEDPEMRLRFEI